MRPTDEEGNVARCGEERMWTGGGYSDEEIICNINGSSPPTLVPEHIQAPGRREVSDRMLFGATA